jgi:hypothetical protein
MANEQLALSGLRILRAFGVWRGKNFANFARMIFLWWGGEKSPFFYTAEKPENLPRAAKMAGKTASGRLWQPPRWVGN